MLIYNFNMFFHHSPLAIGLCHRDNMIPGVKDLFEGQNVCEMFTKCSYT
jgi:hypothetical protein